MQKILILAVLFHIATADSPVFHVEGCDGRYTLTYEDARSECEKYRTEIATYEDLEEAWNVGYEKCRAGWLDGVRVAYPMQEAIGTCGNKVGIVEVNNVDESKTYDVYCKTHGY
ncbi:tumor necrosis factor-inducible gene 6 protein-like isoform X2 [Ptychodera flava]|uniref:tumor necrosis factor-inducible gene 6 protein-like isoform X2 n=1 Tax=Ptychodera flava TaxID=63121 RepID=UPI003969E4BE